VVAFKLRVSYFDNCLTTNIFVPQLILRAIKEMSEESELCNITITLDCLEKSSKLVSTKNKEWRRTRKCRTEATNKDAGRSSRRLPSSPEAATSHLREIPKDNSGLRGSKVLISSSCPSSYYASAGHTLTPLQKKQSLRLFPAQIFAREAVSIAAPRVQMREYEWLSTHTHDTVSIDNRYGNIRNMCGIPLDD